jgi:hypothetical protein
MAARSDTDSLIDRAAVDVQPDVIALLRSTRSTTVKTATGVDTDGGY